jgi:hypothetical protein
MEAVSNFVSLNNLTVIHVPAELVTYLIVMTIPAKILMSAFLLRE